MKLPEISDEKLAELLKRISPVVRDKKGRLMNIGPVDPRRTAFTWDPKFTVPAKGLVELQQIETIHAYGAPVFFKPSIAEVLAQIPEELLLQVTAFEVSLAGDGSTASSFTRDGSYHRANTVLYR